LEACFIVWIVTAQCVNFAFYLAVTRVACGWTKTIVAYVGGYVLPLAASLIWLNPHLHGGERGTAGELAFGFVVFFLIWGAITVAMSRGSRGRRLFSVLVCGVHQVGAFVFSLLAMNRLASSSFGAGLACVIMVGMGVFLVCWGIPSVKKMDETAGWRELNLTAAMNFALLFATGFWPSYVPTGSLHDIAVFVIANVVAIVYFPVCHASAEKNRIERALRDVESNSRVLFAELKLVRAVNDTARRIRHDLRHHNLALVELMKQNKVSEALDYLKELGSEQANLEGAGCFWCENDTVNAILTGCSRKAKAKGLEFSVEARVPRQLRINDMELVAVLANLIENAVNGAAHGTVRVSVIEDRGVLRIGVSNAVADGFSLTDGLPCPIPGVGIMSVRMAVEKHHGLFDYVLNAGELTARVMLGGVA